MGRAVWEADKFWKVGGGRISEAPDCPVADSVRAQGVTEDFRTASLGNTRQTPRASYSPTARGPVGQAHRVRLLKRSGLLGEREDNGRGGLRGRRVGLARRRASAELQPGFRGRRRGSGASEALPAQDPRRPRPGVGIGARSPVLSPAARSAWLGRTPAVQAAALASLRTPSPRTRRPATSTRSPWRARRGTGTGWCLERRPRAGPTRKGRGRQG